MTEKIKLGILGATGMAGRDAVIHQRKLEENGDDYASLELVTGSSSSQGRPLRDVFQEKEEALSEKYGFWEPQECPEEYRDLTVQGLDTEEISEKVDYVISALPSSVASRIEPELRERGVHVFSNASEFRWNEDIPLMIPEVNPGDIEMLEEQETPGKQANNPNCTTAAYVPVIEALRSEFGVEAVDLVTFQAISGKGDKVAGDEYASRINGNLIDDWDEKSNHNGEEVKSEIEPQKILGLADNKEEAKSSGLEIDAQTARVSTQYGHLESLRIEFSEDMDVDDVRETLENWRPGEEVRSLPSTAEKPLKVLDRQPEPRRDVFDQEGMSVVVGDLRQLEDDRIAMFSLSHNLRRGATWTARQSMELYLKKKGLL
ncbi:MAG: aspartate-semialdehyde dehydrogenase [Candidatus Nanohalobium sp.]